MIELLDEGREGAWGRSSKEVDRCLAGRVDLVFHGNFLIRSVVFGISATPIGLQRKRLGADNSYSTWKH